MHPKTRGLSPRGRDVLPLGLTALIAVPAFAPTFAAAEDAPIKVLDPVVVEASPLTDTSAGPVDGWRALTDYGVTRTGTPIEQIPQSVQVVPRQLIEEQGAMSVQEALRNVPGVVPSRDDEILLANPIIRGFEARTYFEGMPAYSFTNTFDSLSTMHVERIEAIKGPSAALFGGGVGAPLGGMINVVRKRPVADEFFVEGVAQVGSYADYGGAVDMNAPLVESGRLRFRGQADYRDRGSHIDDVQSEQFNIFPVLEADVSEDTKISLLGFYGYRDFIEYPGLPDVTTTLSGFDADQFPGADPAPKSQMRRGSVQAMLDHRFNDAWSAHASVQYLEDNFDENDSFLFGQTNAFVPGLPDTVFNVVNGFLNQELSETTLTAWGVGKFETGPVAHTVLFGAEYDRVDYEAELSFDLFGGGTLDIANPVRPPFTTAGPGSVSEVETESYSMFVQEQATLFGRLHLLGALRWTHLTVDDDEVTAGTRVKSTVRELTPRIGAAFDVTKEVSVFAGYGEGFDQPVFASPTTPPKPERSYQYEAGVRLNMPGGLSGSVALFHITRENVPTADPANPGTQIQVGEQRAQGVEANVLWQPTPAFSALAVYAFTDAAVTEDNTLPEGDKLARVPRHAGRVALQYRFLDGDFAGLSLGSGVTAASGAEITLPNAFDADGYAVVDARIAYDLGPAEIGLSVENLFDEDYDVPHAFLAQNVAQGRPLTVMATVRARY